MLYCRSNYDLDTNMSLFRQVHDGKFVECALLLKEQRCSVFI